MRAISGRIIAGIGIGVVVFSLTMASWAQTPPVASEQAPAGGDSVLTQASADTASGFPQQQPNLSIRELDKAGNLPLSLGYTHLGPLYLRSFTFQELVQSVETDSGRPAGLPAHTVSSLFRTELAFERTFRTSRLVFQYQPQLAIVDGQVQKDYSNQHLSFDTRFALGPRWTLAIGDTFSYVGRQSAIGEYLNFDSVTSDTFQRQFLDGSINFLTNTVRASLVRRVSATTDLSISPYFAYTTSSGTAYENASAAQVSGFTDRVYAVSTRLNHAISARTTVGSYYTYQLIQSAPSYLGTTYHIMGVSYSRQLSPTLAARVNAGATAAGFPGSHLWTTSGSASLSKTFGQSSLAFTYSRSESFAGFVGYVSNNAISDRADASYQMQLRRKLSARTAYGYFTGISGNGERISAQYVTGGLAYRLLPRLSWSAEYTTKFQDGDNSQVLGGTRSLIMLGLRWDLGAKENLQSY